MHSLTHSRRPSANSPPPATTASPETGKWALRCVRNLPSDAIQSSSTSFSAACRKKVGRCWCCVVGARRKFILYFLFDFRVTKSNQLLVMYHLFLLLLQMHEGAGNFGCSTRREMNAVELSYLAMACGIIIVELSSFLCSLRSCSLFMLQRGQSTCPSTLG